MARGYLSEDEARDRHEESNPEPVTLPDVHVIKVTPKALLVRQNSSRRQFWVPQSVIHANSEVYAADTAGKLVIHGWWARSNGVES